MNLFHFEPPKFKPHKEYSYIHKLTGSVCHDINLYCAVRYARDDVGIVVDSYVDGCAKRETISVKDATRILKLDQL